jgi:Protein of unknown function (DUF2934)
MKTKAHKTHQETPKSSPNSDLREQIEKRAYEIWLTSGGRYGDDIIHWLQAENEVMAQHQEKLGQASANI